jgi:protein gp37
VAARFAGPGLPYEGLAKRVKRADGSSEARWTGKVVMASDDVLTMPLRWRRPRLIFVNSMSDLFHESVPDKWIDRIFAVMALCPQHTFQVLTKRPKRMRAYLSCDPDVLRNRWYCAVPAGKWPISVAEAYAAIHPHCSNETRAIYRRTAAVWPLPNVWLGVSVEDQARADERIPELLATPAAIRWISAEPLLSDIRFRGTSEDGQRQWDWLTGETGTMFRDGPDFDQGPKLDWVVAGGESGRGARPMHPAWARSLRDQCAAAGVPFFFKQWGEWADERQLQFWVSDRFFTSDGKMTPGLWHEWPDSFCAVKVGKTLSGRTFDGVEHSAMPEGGR